jgi:hypothetical protein
MSSLYGKIFFILFELTLQGELHQGDFRQAINRRPTARRDVGRTEAIVRVRVEFEGVYYLFNGHD